MTRRSVATLVVLLGLGMASGGLSTRATAQGDAPGESSPAQPAQDVDAAAKAEAARRAAAAQAREMLLAEARKRVPEFDKDAFVAWMREKGAPAAAIEAFESDWKAGPDAKITHRALLAIDPVYAKAYDLVLDGKPDGVLELTKIVASTGDAVTRAHARYDLARALLDEDDPEGASQLLSDFVIESRGLTMLDGEAVFYYAYALSLIPQVDTAIVNLKVFLDLYPNAGERYRANAEQLLQELEAQWRSPLHALADEMKSAERKLRKERYGDPLNVQQLDIVSKLAQLIEEMEKQQQGGGPPSGNQIPNGPANNSALPEGQGRVGKLHGSRGVKDRWGNMKDKDRAKILNELQTKLPERYRVLLENYYKRVNAGGN
ncbi:MAG: hypothetical protein KDC95_01965 [Planctomycetes bacterium]|nr:hypothetical protein [Planctomycetota bacterium]